MIKRWHLKAIVQKTISFMPNGHKVNYWFQKNITKGVFLGDEYFYDRLEHAQHHIGAFRQHVGMIEDRTTLELGTGWYPVVPISLFLVGAGKITTVDISPLTNKEKLKDTFGKFIESMENGQLYNYIQPLPEREAQLKELATKLDQLSEKEIIGQLNIHYLVEDARDLQSIATDSIDLVHSNNTFEHVYPNILKGILKEFGRTVNPAGLMSHFVDMSDHFAHFDKSINIYNFLQYSEFAWDRVIDNSIQPQNRWRYQDYLDLYQELNIPILDTKIREGNIDEVKSLKIHKEFSKFDVAELAISHCYLYSKMN